MADDELNAKDVINSEAKKIEQLEKSSKARLKKTTEFIEKECKKISKLLDKCSKSYEDQVKDLDKTLREIESSEKTVNQFTTDVDNLQTLLKSGTLKMSAKQINQVLTVLNRTGASIEDFLQCLQDNWSDLDDATRDLAVSLSDLGENAQDAFDEIIEGSESIKKNLKDASGKFDDFFDTTEDKLKDLSSAVANLGKISKQTKMVKADPAKIYQDYRAILKTQESDVESFAFKSGMDAETTNELKTRLAEIRNNLEDYEQEIFEEMQNMTTKNAFFVRRRVQKKIKQGAAELAGFQNEFNKIEKAYGEKKKTIDLASRGIGGLADEAADVSDHLRQAVGNLRSFNLVAAVSSFKTAHNKSQEISKAAKLIEAGAKTRNIAQVAKLAKWFGKIAALTLILVAIVKLFIDARDRAATLNKTLFEAGGLAGMGFNMSATTNYKEMSDELYQIRDEIIGGLDKAWDFAVSAQDISNVIREMGKQGVMISELREGGRNIRDAVSGVFTYARLLGKSDTEMGSTMAEIATDLSLGMDEVESRFADLTRRWQGTRLSVDQFMGSVKEISSEHIVFGDKMTEVSALLEMTGKNSMLTSKQAMDATKATTSALEKMSVGQLRSYIELTGGPAGVMKKAKKRISALQMQLADAKRTGSKNVGPLEYQIRRLSKLASMYETGDMGNTEIAQILPLLGEGQQAAFLMEVAGAVIQQSGQALDQVTMDQLDYTMPLGKAAMGVLGMQRDEYIAFHNQVMSAAGGPDSTFTQAVSKLDNLKTHIGDNTKAVEKNKKDAITASKQLLDSQKALEILQDNLFHKLYGQVRGVEELLLKIVNYFTKSNADKQEEKIRSKFSNIDKMDPNSGEFTNALKDMLKDFQGLASDGASKEKMQNLFNAMPKNMQNAFSNLANSNTGALPENLKKELKKNPDLEKKLVTMASEVMNGLKDSSGNVVTQKNSSIKSLGAGSGMVNFMNKKGLTAKDLDKTEVNAAMSLQALSAGTPSGFEAAIMDEKGNIIRSARIGTGKHKSVNSPLAGEIEKMSSGHIRMKVLDPSGRPMKNLAVELNGKFDPTPGLKTGSKVTMGQFLGFSHNVGDKIAMSAEKLEGGSWKEIGIGQAIATSRQQKELNRQMAEFLKKKENLNKMVDFAKKTLPYLPGGLGASWYLENKEGADAALNAWKDAGVNTWTFGKSYYDAAMNGNGLMDALLSAIGNTVQGTSHDAIRTSSVTNENVINNNVRIRLDDKKMVRDIARSLDYKRRQDEFRKNMTMA